MNAFNWWGLLTTILAGLTVFWVQRQALAADKYRDKIDARMSKLEDKVATLEMRIASEIPNRDDYKEQNRRMEAFEALLHEVRDAVIRMEARSK